MNGIFNIKQVKIVCVTFALTQQNLFVKYIKLVRLGQPALLIGQVRVEKSWQDY